MHVSRSACFWCSLKCRVAKKSGNNDLAVPSADLDQQSRVPDTLCRPWSGASTRRRCTPFPGTVVSTTGSGSGPNPVRPIGSARRGRVPCRAPDLLQYRINHPNAWMPERHHGCASNTGEQLLVSLSLLCAKSSFKPQNQAMTVPTSTTATRGKALPGGIYCPSISFFKPTAAQELDLDTYTKHIEFLAKAGVHGVVVLGSTAEAVALTRDERKQVSPAFCGRIGRE